MQGGNLEPVEAAKKICYDLELPLDKFLEYSAEDTLGGYPDEWTRGGIFAVEGQVLYALVRLLRPKTVLEFGSGCSTVHIFTALERNAYGHVISVDIGWGGPRLVPSPRATYEQVEAIGFAQSLEGDIDLVFEDVGHSERETYGVLTGCLPNLVDGGLLVSHDVLHFLVGEEVSRGFLAAVGPFQSVMIEPSDCGLGYWRKHDSR